MVKLLKAVVEVPHELLIVYDSPEDDSIPVIRDMQNDYTNLRLVHNQRGRGVVNAIRRAWKPHWETTFCYSRPTKSGRCWRSKICWR